MDTQKITQIITEKNQQLERNALEYAEDLIQEKCHACKGLASQISVNSGRVFWKRSGRMMGWL